MVAEQAVAAEARTPACGAAPSRSPADRAAQADECPFSSLPFQATCLPSSGFHCSGSLISRSICAFCAKSCPQAPSFHSGVT